MWRYSKRNKRAPSKLSARSNCATEPQANLLKGLNYIALDERYLRSWNLVRWDEIVGSVNAKEPVSVMPRDPSATFRPPLHHAGTSFRMTRALILSSVFSESVKIGSICGRFTDVSRMPQCGIVAARRSSSSGLTSSTWVEIVQRCPNGSSKVPERSP